MQFFVSIGAGFVLWLVDYFGCAFFESNNIINPHGHVWWHLLMGYAAYCSVTMLKCLDDNNTNTAFLVRYNLLGLPKTYKKTVNSMIDLTKEAKTTTPNF